MRPTTAEVHILDLDALLHPGSYSSIHAMWLIITPSVSPKSARFWQRGFRRVRDRACPALRAPEGSQPPVAIDEIVEALCLVDGGPSLPGRKSMWLRSIERRAAA